MEWNEHIEHLPRIKEKAVKALYPIGHSLSIEKCSFDDSPSPCRIKKQKTNKKKNSQYFAIPVRVATGKNRIRILTI